MGLKKVLQLVALSLFVSSLGLTIHRCAGVARAFEGSAPVAVSNGDVSLTCADNNRILGKTSSSVTCLSDLPDDVTQNAVQLTGYTSLFAHDNGVVSYSNVGGTNYLGNAKTATDAVGIGVCTAASGCTGATALKTFDLIVTGAATALKVGDNVINAGDRVKLDLRGEADAQANVAAGGPATTYYGCTTYQFFTWNYYCQKVIAAADNEAAIGVATETVASSATEVTILVGVKVAPIETTATSPVAVSSSGVVSIDQSGIDHVSIMQTTQVGATADLYFPVMGTELSGHSALTAGRTTTFMPAGAITSAIKCRCDDAVATDKSVEIELCKNEGTDCSSSDTDVVSECTIGAGQTSCSDSSWSGDYSVEAGDSFYFYADRTGGTGCQYYQCRFTFSSSE